jgi:methanogenic corrinoid protein MtbC1
MTRNQRLDPASLPALISALDERGSLEEVRRRVRTGQDPLDIIADCRLGMQYVGENYERGEYYISGLIMAGEIFREAMEVLEPLLPAGRGAPASSAEAASPGSVLMCTVRGDIHDIGKNIVVLLLRSYGYAVHDLGVDVPALEVVHAALELRPEVVGLSGLLIAAHDSMRETVAQLRRAARQVGYAPVVAIGGRAVDEDVREWTGADLWANEAVQGIHAISAAITHRS